MYLINDEGENMFKSDDLKVYLKTNTVTVVFTKLNGEERRLKCTLNEQFIPITESKQTNTTKKQNTDVMSVWDLENSGWRSFRVDSIKHIELT